MKRFAAIFFALALLLTLCSCQKQAPELPAAEYDIEILEEYCKLDGNSVKLLYPKISGLADTETEQLVNRKASEYARSVYELCGLGAGGYEYTASAAEILLSTRDLFSVLVTGVFAPQSGGDAAAFAYTVNCDLTTVEFLGTKEIVSDYDGLKRLFLSGAFSPDFGYDAAPDDGELQAMVGQYKEEYGIYPDFYFQNGKLGILIETLPALGGYAGFTVDIGRAAPYLCTDRAGIAAVCPQ